MPRLGRRLFPATNQTHGAHGGRQCIYPLGLGAPNHPLILFRLPSKAPTATLGPHTHTLHIISQIHLALLNSAQGSAQYS